MAAKKAPAKPKAKVDRGPQGPQLAAELLDPWERQPGESAEAYEGWQAYRDMESPRSTRKVARLLGKSIAAVSKHSTRWQWVARAQIWDVEQDRVKTRAMLRKQEELGRRHATMAQDYLAAMTPLAVSTMKRIEEDPEWFASLGPKDTMRTLAIVARAFPGVAVAERLAVGLNTEGPAAPDLAGEMRSKSDSEIESFLTGVDAGRDAERAAVEKKTDGALP